MSIGAQRTASATPDRRGAHGGARYCPSVATEYAKALGARLRAVRTQQGLSLQGLQERSGGRWKAVVVGSWERGDRAVTVERLAELAAFYGVPMAALVPEVGAGATTESPVALVLDVTAVDRLSGEETQPLVRFTETLQARRGTGALGSLVVGEEDLAALATIYGSSERELTRRLADWGVIGRGRVRRRGSAGR